ncbi:MAG: hypothetical protein WAU89_13415 [Candidatus Acidiferrales bacterium]
MTDRFDEVNLVPQYYVVSRNLTPARTDHVVHVLKFTPIAAAIITNIDDADLARKLCELVIQVPTLPEAYEMSRTYGEPTLIVSGEPSFYAHYADGHSYEINLNAQI